MTLITEFTYCFDLGRSDSNGQTLRLNQCVSGAGLLGPHTRVTSVRAGECVRGTVDASLLPLFLCVLMSLRCGWAVTETLLDV